MRTRACLLVLAMTVIAYGSAQAAAVRRSRRCGPSGAETIAADSVARVYSQGGDIYGCAVGVRRHYLLGSSSRSIRQGRVDPVTLAGRVAAYGVTSYGVDTVSATVVVRSLRDGKELRSDPATSRPVGAEFVESVNRVVVKRDGSAAWTSTAGSLVSEGKSEIEVDRDDVRGRALLDSGPGIAADSLRLRGSRLSWRNGAVTRSATLR